VGAGQAPGMGYRQLRMNRGWLLLFVRGKADSTT
jgi:hypothetical protein